MQKSGYERRSRDWSAEVCFSDIHAVMDLDGTISHGVGHVRREDFDRGYQVGGFLVAIFVHRVGGFEGEQARLLDLDEGSRDVLAYAAVLRQQIGRAHV